MSVQVHHRCFFYTFQQYLFMWGAVFACLLHHSLCRCHMCWIELFTPHRGSQHTPVFRYLRQTCLVSPKQSSLSFDTLVPKVLEVQRAPQILTTKQLQSPSTCWSATEWKLSSTFDTVNRAEDQTTRTPFYVVKETPSSTQCTWWMHAHHEPWPRVMNGSMTSIRYS